MKWLIEGTSSILTYGPQCNIVGWCTCSDTMFTCNILVLKSMLREMLAASQSHMFMSIWISYIGRCECHVRYCLTGDDGLQQIVG